MNNQLSKTTRRNLLKASALGLPLASVGSLLGKALALDDAHPKAKTEPRPYFDKGKRLSIAMWDFSWLMSHYPGGAYEDLDRRVAEAAERGYNTLRVDCFPSRILERESTFPKKDWTPGTNLPQWGEIAEARTCDVRKELGHLADLCRKHGLWLGLDSWDTPHMFRSTELPFLQISGAPSGLFGKPSAIKIPSGDEERAFTAYGEIWARALKMMREDGVLERAVWIAPMNEVPNFAGSAVESIIAVQHRLKVEGETKNDVNEEIDAIYQRVNHFMGVPIKAEIVGDRIPLSYCSNGDKNYAARLTDIYDVVDLHFMPGVPTDKEDDAAFAQAAHGITGTIRFAEFEKFDLKAWSQAYDRACRKHYPEMLKRTHNFFHNALDQMQLPSGKQLAAITTECFGPVFWPDSPDVNWKWYQHYNADALRIVAAMNIAGSSLSNFAEPLFTLWNDVDWHWTSNTYFQTLGELSAPKPQ